MGSDKLANEGGEDFDDDMAASVEDLASRLQTHPSASSPTSTETGKNDMLVDDGFADVDFTLSDAPPVGFHPAKCQETTSPTPVASSDGQPPANVVGSLALSVPVSDESASRSTARSKDSSQLMTTQAPPAAGTATAAALPPTSAPGPHAHTQQPLPAVPSDVYRFDIAVQGGTNYAAHLSNNEIRTTNKQGPRAKKAFAGPPSGSQVRENQSKGKGKGKGKGKRKTADGIQESAGAAKRARKD